MKLSIQDYISIKIHKTDLKLTSYIKSELEPFNIAPEQNLIMMLLWENDGLTQNQVAAKLNKDKTNIARMSTSLEKKGFIERINCTNDRRSLKLYLTSNGNELKNKIIPITEGFNEIVASNMTENELLELERLLSKVNKNMAKLL